ncbi:MAG: hypothetical protein J6B03_02815 [Candidatus Homeothermus sp.]|jgi:hypothetical protein|nr:hypothetical protein [Candidatus Homeothermus sp.]PWL59661.1 MAG: hypothetical protein DBY35_10225 [Bacteroidales bacterium]
MKDITDLFQELLHNNRSVDIAEAEFKKLIHEDAELHEQYRDWCDAVGSSEKMGFLDYCDEYLESQDSIYDTLNDYDE